MKNNKSPGNGSLKKEFYEAFWDHVNVPLLVSFKITFLRKKQTKHFLKRNCTKIYQEKGLRQEVYKRLESYIFT